MSTILAVDPGIASIGLSVFQDNNLESLYCIKTKKVKKNAEDNRRSEVVVAFNAILKKVQPDVLIIESQYLHFNVKAMSVVVEMKGLFKGLFIVNCLSLGKHPKMLEIHPMEAKSAVGLKKTLKSVESKIAVKEAVCARYPDLVKQNEDAIDSVAIGLAGIGKLAASNMFR